MQNPYSYGYCSYDGPPPREDQFITRVRRAKHWGFCSDQCNTKSETHNLKETKLTVLNVDDCVRFNSSTLGYRDDGELCAGSKTPYPVMKVYTRKKFRKGSSNRTKYTFINIEDEINTVCIFQENYEIFYLQWCKDISKYGHTDFAAFLTI